MCKVHLARTAFAASFWATSCVITNSQVSWYCFSAALYEKSWFIHGLHMQLKSGFGSLQVVFIVTLDGKLRYRNW